mmetsp:Transcript_2047/g.3141  ORF Transcript_2047/g.3141 Transcript_2047/m.3141 type:complete len:307 (-) Transcript_2047:357-1277(-)|eukprot:CAMPEP_0194257032 /NCGR_PEP_ID=MMETSP0158-20130606/38097_1 /TAXON_ID=33649 /ORGANISM="Thalassionema nitzschioides, Strain L26-B" /LENGTH=306 /DNA_ID=CAMNT_0038995945 /DNA_START=14 /DNA_END=934 /DNA_ORIENTATION=+
MDRLQNDERYCPQRMEEFRSSAKAKLLPDQFKRLNDEDLARFIVAREGNVPAALKQLTGSVKWAETALDPNQQDCEFCSKDISSHSMIPIGLEESEQSTILYGCPARATQPAVDPIIHHMSHQLEYCFALPHSGSRWIWCVDYNGFGLKEAMQGKLAARFGALFSNHMPERLHRVILLNPPSVFRILLNFAKPFVDQRTLDKLVPVNGSTSEVLQTLREDHAFTESTLKWLAQALNQKLPAKIPTLPHDSRGLMLPSLIPKFEFVDPVSPMKDSAGRRPLFIRASSLLIGEVDAKNQIQIIQVDGY